ncbi:unnamed protein product [Toxocara canis]|uniref:Cadherin domain-containing protein n=1 Tax=Toxocara canis TaxID=6265 RepID=A0A183U8Z9_TOXCA|nr:unnamed protein product [Toxocara canis]
MSMIDPRVHVNRIESGATTNIYYNISTTHQGGYLRDMMITLSVDGELVALEDSRTFFVQEHISSTALLVKLSSSPDSMYFFDIKTSAVHSVVPLVFVQVLYSDFGILLVLFISVAERDLLLECSGLDEIQ